MKYLQTALGALGCSEVLSSRDRKPNGYKNPFLALGEICFQRPSYDMRKCIRSSSLPPPVPEEKWSQCHIL